MISGMQIVTISFWGGCGWYFFNLYFLYLKHFCSEYVFSNYQKEKGNSVIPELENLARRNLKIRLPESSKGSVQANQLSEEKHSGAMGGVLG